MAFCEAVLDTQKSHVFLFLINSHESVDVGYFDYQGCGYVDGEKEMERLQISSGGIQIRYILIHRGRNLLRVHFSGHIPFISTGRALCY